MFVASFNLPLPFVFDILFVGDKPADVIIKRKETTAKRGEEGDDALVQNDRGLARAETRNQTRHCHQTGIKLGMMDIFRDDSFTREHDRRPP